MPRLWKMLILSSVLVLAACEPHIHLEWHRHPPATEAPSPDEADDIMTSDELIEELLNEHQ